jgi:hypothetical protein
VKAGLQVDGLLNRGSFALAAAEADVSAGTPGSAAADHVEVVPEGPGAGRINPTLRPSHDLRPQGHSSRGGTDEHNGKSPFGSVPLANEDSHAKAFDS